MTAVRGLTPTEIDRLFAPLRSASGLLAAVSGGPDSMALLLALAVWRRGGEAPPVTIVTVDHGLRAASAEEALAVGVVARDHGFPHVVLTWAGDKPETGLQEAARQARYALLAEEALPRGASHVVTAHTRSDQAETVLLRLCAGSGPSGLAGMRPTSRLAGLVLARPFLDLSKPRLVATCLEAGVPFADDPSNGDPRFARARLRRAVAGLAREGLTEARLARLAARMAKDDDALSDLARRALDAARGPAGYDAALLFAQPPAVADRALASAISESGSSARLERLEHLADEVRSAVTAAEPLTRTLAGLLVRLDSRGILTLAPEPSRRRGKGLHASNVAGPPHSLGNGDAHA